MISKNIFIIIIVVILIVVGLIVFFMMSNKGPAGVTGLTGPTNKNVAPKPSEAAAAAKINATRITMDDNNFPGYSVSAGSNLAVMLDKEHDWMVAVDDASILVKGAVPADLANAQALYTAAQKGKATILATGTCKSKTAGCEPTTFKLTVNVISGDFNPTAIPKEDKK